MKIILDISLHEFKAWGGAQDTLNTLTWGQIDEVSKDLDSITDEEAWTDDTLNDWLWHSRDELAQLLDYSDWEILLKENMADIL